MSRIPMNRAAAALTVATFAPAAHAAGMPQLQFDNPLLLGQVVWGAIIFAVFYVVLSRSALPAVARVLAHRRGRIEGDLEIARRAKQDADAAVEDLRRARHDAAVEAQANVSKVVAEARAAAEAQTHEMNARLEAQIAEAETRIEASRTQALGTLREAASDTARALVDRLLGHQAEGQDFGQAVAANAARHGL